MAPKAAAKGKAAAANDTKPNTKASGKTPQPKAPTTTTTTKAPSKKKEAATYSGLEKEKGAAIPVDVTFEGGSVESKSAKAGGSYQHKLKLEAASPFTLVQTRMTTDENGNQQQIIILKPAKAFPFLKVPQESRKRIYELYFAPKGTTDPKFPLVMEGKRKGSGEIYAKSYAEGSKNRVAILAVNKEIHAEALPLLYAQAIRFESSSTLLDFLGLLPSSLTPFLRNIEIKNWIKISARNALAFLASATSLDRLKIELAVSTEPDATKAAKNFWLDAQKLLKALADAKAKAALAEGNEDFEKESVIKVLEFGPGAFKSKDGKQNFDDDWRTEFIESLEAKMV